MLRCGGFSAKKNDQSNNPCNPWAVYIYIYIQIAHIQSCRLGFSKPQDSAARVNLLHEVAVEVPQVPCWASFQGSGFRV